MKKLTVSLIALVLSSVFLVLSGCEMSLNLEETTTAPASTTTTEPNTAVIEVTDAQGEVVATQTVTASPEAEQVVKDFFTPVTQPATQKGEAAKPNAGISADRLQQAVNSQQTPSTTIGQQNSNTTNSGTTKPGVLFTEVVQQDDEAVLRSSQYMITCRIVSEGEVSVFRIARKNKKSAIFFNQNDEKLGLIINGDYVYYMSIDQRVYMEIPKSMLEEHAEKEDLDLDVIYEDPMSFERVPVGVSTEVIDGVEYTVKEYEGGNKDYFVGKTIIMTTSTDGSVMYYDSVSAVAPESVFLPPAGFAKEEFNAENVSEFVDEVEGVTEHNHEE